MIENVGFIVLFSLNFIFKTNNLFICIMHSLCLNMWFYLITHTPTKPWEAVFVLSVCIGWASESVFHIPRPEVRLSRNA